MDKVAESILNIIKAIIPYVWVLAAVGLFSNSILCVTGKEEGREKAKKALPWVGIGSVGAVGAIYIIEWGFKFLAF